MYKYGGKCVEIYQKTDITSDVFTARRDVNSLRGSGLFHPHWFVLLSIGAQVSLGQSNLLEVFENFSCLS